MVGDILTLYAALGLLLVALRNIKPRTAVTLAAQLSFAPFLAVGIWLGQGPPALAMFLLGLAAGKRRLLEDTPALARWLPRIQLTGFLVGGPVAVWSWPRRDS